MATRDVESTGEVREGVAVDDGDDVGDAVAAVEDETGEETLRVQGENGLDLDVDAVETPRLEHRLHHLLSVSLRILRRIREENLALARVHAELVVERVPPHLVHVLPVLDGAVRDGVRHLSPTEEVRGEGQP